MFLHWNLWELIIFVEKILFPVLFLSKNEISRFRKSQNLAKLHKMACDNRTGVCQICFGVCFGKIDNSQKKTNPKTNLSGLKFILICFYMKLTPNTHSSPFCARSSNFSTTLFSSPEINKPMFFFESRNFVLIKIALHIIFLTKTVYAATILMQKFEQKISSK